MTPPLPGSHRTRRQRAQQQAAAVSRDSAVQQEVAACIVEYENKVCVDGWAQQQVLVGGWVQQALVDGWVQQQALVGDRVVIMGSVGLQMSMSIP